MSERSTIYIVDDDELAPLKYQELLCGLGAVLRIYSSAEKFLEEYSTGPHECLICELSMHGMGGLELQGELMAIGVHLPIIFLSGSPRLSCVVAALKAGAFDFLEKSTEPTCLQESVRLGLEKSRVLHSAHLAERERSARLSSLTLKEREIADRVVVGFSSRQISHEMGLSVRTVENHRARIAEKLHLRSTVELVNLLRYGI